MKKITVMILALAVSLSAACVEPTEDAWNLRECTGEECETEQQDQPDLSATYVSGHLGNYLDCPGDGYTAESTMSGEAPSDGDDGAFAGDCAEGEDCSYEMNCEDAQITLRLSNDGEGEATGLQVVTIELFDGDGVSKATLPLIDAIDTDTAESFDGTLEASEEVNLRVEFQGPASPHTLLSTSDDDGGDAGDEPTGGDRMGTDDHGIIEVTIGADNHDDVTVESTELYPVPSVAT
ncbi:MAG: hypothetical protein ACLFVJ_12985 [Persicimonas sp.]